MAQDTDKMHPLYQHKLTEEIRGVITETGEIIDLDNPEIVKSLSENLSETKVITYKYRGDLATGVVIPSRHPASVQYLRDLADYNNQSADVKQQMELSRKLYIWEGIVGTVIDMFCDFATTDIKVENVKNKKGQEIIEYFLRELNNGYNNITTGKIALSHMISFCYFVDGNVFLYNKWSKVKYGKRAGQTAKIPMLIVPINPMVIDIPEDSLDFGNKEIRIDLSTYTSNKTTSELNRLGKNKAIPLRIRRHLQKREHFVPLSDDEIYHIKRRGTTFGGWGIPYLSRAFSAIASKRRLRTLDDSTTDGMINTITIFKVGDPDQPVTLHPSRITRLQSLLSNPTSSLTLAWSYDIDVLYVGPKGEILDFSDKYKQVNYDVVSALGVPVSLLTGQGDRAGDVWVSMMVLMERLEECRHEVREYMRFIVNRLLEANDIYGENPTIRTPSTRIRKEDVKNQVLSLWDRGVISYDTALEEAGFDFEAEYQKKQAESKMDVEEVFKRPSLPFDSPDGKPADRKTVDEKEKQIDSKPSVDMKDEKKPKVATYMEPIENNLKWLRGEFTRLTKSHNINYAANWYAGRAHKVAQNLGDLGYGINSAAKLLSLVSTTNRKITIINAIRNIEQELLSAVHKTIWGVDD